MDFIRLGFAGTKCGSSYPRQRLWAVTCFPPTNWATEARSVNDVATFRSANAGAAASRPSTVTTVQRVSDFMNSLRVFSTFGCTVHRTRAVVISVRMGRVMTDRVAHLDHEAIVVRPDSMAAVRLGVAVLESHERELWRHPGDVGRDPVYLAGNRGARTVDQEIREAVTGLLGADARPPDL